MKRVIFLSFLTLFLFGAILGYRRLTERDDNPKDERAAATDAEFFKRNLTKSEHLVPMRDGVRLFTAVYTPKNRSDKCPILLFRTPYFVDPYGPEEYKTVDMTWYGQLIRCGYIVAFQDVRGRGMSEGTFTNMTPHIDAKKTRQDVDESSDTHDTVEWLINNVPNNNGKVGLLGISYRGFYASAGAIDTHPALRAVSPQAPMADVYFDDFHHNGAFMMAYVHSLNVFGVPRPEPTKTKWYEEVKMDIPDGYEFFRRLMPLHKVNERVYKGKNEFWNAFVDHPDYDDYWRSRNILPHLKNIRSAVMTVAGWYDAEDLYGSFNTFYAIERQNPGIKNILVAGPWVHGGWSRSDGTKLGDVYFVEGVSQYFHDKIELPFFNHYLRGEGEDTLPKAYVFETGRNRWRRFDAWPPKACRAAKLHLHKDGRLAESAVPEAGFREFNSDPEHPVPLAAGIAAGMPREYMTDDQRFAGRRNDVLVYQTEILTEPLTLAGPLTAHLCVSTSAGDADWIVKLIDVYPDDHPNFEHNPPHVKMAGYQQMVRSEVFRGRYRKSFSEPVRFEADKVETVRVPLQDVLHTFKKGHRVMVQIQSTWFPLVDINPQKYVANIYKAKAEDFVKATHRVYQGGEHASALEVLICPE